MAWQKFNLKLNKKYSKQERKAIATDVIDFIVNRSRKDGKDKNNRPFKKYSKGYLNSLDFKIGGKSGKVDLTLSGDMLDSVELISDKSGNLLIGFENHTEENGKAEGNIKGTYGQKRPTGKSRDFLGISTRDMAKVLRNYPIGDEEARKERAELINGREES